MGTEYAQDPIKVEGNESEETVTEIQSYLEGFQKEIAGSDTSNVQQVAGKYELFFFWIINEPYNLSFRK